MITDGGLDAEGNKLTVTPRIFLFHEEETRSCGRTRSLWQAEVHEFHLFHAPKANSAHQSLQKQVCFFVASVQWADKNVIEDLESFQAA